MNDIHVGKVFRQTVSFVFLLCNEARPNEIAENVCRSDIPITHWQEHKIPDSSLAFSGWLCLHAFEAPNKHLGQIVFSYEAL